VIAYNMNLFIYYFADFCLFIFYPIFHSFISFVCLFIHSFISISQGQRVLHQNKELMPIYAGQVTTVNNRLPAPPPVRLQHSAIWQVLTIFHWFIIIIMTRIVIAIIIIALSMLINHSWDNLSLILLFIYLFIYPFSHPSINLSIQPSIRLLVR